MSINKAILIGNLGSDPEVRTISNNSKVATFSLATSESFKDKTTGEKKSVTEWHNIVLWNNLAEIATKYLKKGSKVFIEGKIKTRSWDKDGIKRYTTEIVGDNMVMLGEKSQSAQQSVSQSSGYSGPPPDGNTDDLPF